jgi:thioredoxin 2
MRNNDIPVVVDFWASWRGPCTTMAPVCERVTAEMSPAKRLLKADTEAEQQLAERDGIRGIPTLMVFRGGLVLRQRVGASTPERCGNGRDNARRLLRRSRPSRRGAFASRRRVARG